MIWHSNVNNKNLKLDSKEEEILYSKNKSFFLLLKILNVYPLFFEMNIHNLTKTLTEYYQEQINSSSSSQNILDCKVSIFFVMYNFQLIIVDK